jgi:hypothetical protein
MTKKIKNLRSNNSKEFWKLMRKGTYRKQPNISIDTLFDFFKTLNQNPTNDGDGATVLPEIDENLVNNLNIINSRVSSVLLVLLLRLSLR